MSRKSFDPNEGIISLNNIKVAFRMRHLPFKREQLTTALRSSGLPASFYFFKLLEEFGIIIRVNRGEYMFSDKAPIYVGVLRNIQHKYQEAIKKPSKEIKSIPKEDEISKEIEKAIKLLKKEGYQIFMPIDGLYEKL